MPAVALPLAGLPALPAVDAVRHRPKMSQGLDNPALDYASRSLELQQSLHRDTSFFSVEMRRLEGLVQQVSCLEP